MRASKLSEITDPGEAARILIELWHGEYGPSVTYRELCHLTEVALSELLQEEKKKEQR